jgi:hypothetical protein
MNILFLLCLMAIWGASVTNLNHVPTICSSASGTCWTLILEVPQQKTTTVFFSLFVSPQNGLLMPGWPRGRVLFAYKMLQFHADIKTLTVKFQP